MATASPIIPPVESGGLFSGGGGGKVGVGVMEVGIMEEEECVGVELFTVMVVARKVKSATLFVTQENQRSVGLLDAM